MKLRLALIAMAALAAPMAANAQQTAPSAQPVDQPYLATAATASQAPSATQAATPASATFRDPTSPIGSTANPIPQSSPTPVDQASGLTAGESTVVSNGPVADTPANRARFGQPMSHAGRATKPVGN